MTEVADMPWLLLNAGDDDWRDALERLMKDVDDLDAQRLDDGSWFVRDRITPETDTERRKRWSRESSKRHRAKRHGVTVGDTPGVTVGDTQDAQNPAVSQGVSPPGPKGPRGGDKPALVTPGDSDSDSDTVTGDSDTGDSVTGRVPTCAHGWVYDDFGESPCPQGCRR